jgi:hypothetical protein
MGRCRGIRVGYGRRHGGGLGLAYWGARQAWRYKLSKRCVLITGGSRGLGLALARQFQRRGAKVALFGPDRETLERSRQLLRGNGSVFVRPCDVRDRTQVEQAVADVRRELGEIDALVNNAGTITVGPMENLLLGASVQRPGGASLNAPAAHRAHREHLFDRRKDQRAAPSALLCRKIRLVRMVGRFAGRNWPGTMCTLRAFIRGSCAPAAPAMPISKGKHRAEYTWFLLNDSLPVFSVSADRAARQILLWMNKPRKRTTNFRIQPR